MKLKCILNYSTRLTFVTIRNLVIAIVEMRRTEHNIATYCIKILVRPHDNILKKILQYIYIFFFFFAAGHIATLFPVRALYPEPCNRPYEIRIYHHRSFALNVELPVGSGLQDPQQLLVRPA